MSELPKLNCAGCRTCCLGDTVYLLPEDNPQSYKTTPAKDGSGRRALKKGKDGNCVYLGKAGCQIYAAQPEMCRRFDCRVYARGVATLAREAQAQRLAHPRISKILARGVEKLAALGIVVTLPEHPAQEADAEGQHQPG